MAPTGSLLPTSLSPPAWLADLRAKVESEDAAVGEEEVVEWDEEGMSHDGVERAHGLRDLRAPARGAAGARQPCEQRGGELPGRSQLGEPPHERSEPSDGLKTKEGTDE